MFRVHKTGRLDFLHHTAMSRSDNGDETWRWRWILKYERFYAARPYLILLWRSSNWRMCVVWSRFVNSGDETKWNVLGTECRQASTQRVLTVAHSWRKSVRHMSRCDSLMCSSVDSRFSSNSRGVFVMTENENLHFKIHPFFFFWQSSNGTLPTGRTGFMQPRLCGGANR